jgi:hypothetical protein
MSAAEKDALIQAYKMACAGALAAKNVQKIAEEVAGHLRAPRYTPEYRSGDPSAALFFTGMALAAKIILDTITLVANEKHDQ